MKSSRTEPFRHFPFLYQVRRGGYMPNGMFEPMMPVRYSRTVTPAPHPLDPEGFDFREHGRYYDYFIVVFRHADTYTTFGGAGDRVRLLKSSGRFAVYQKTPG